MTVIVWSTPASVVKSSILATLKITLMHVEKEAKRMTQIQIGPLAARMNLKSCSRRAVLVMQGNAHVGLTVQKAQQPEVCQLCHCTFSWR